MKVGRLKSLEELHKVAVGDYAVLGTLWSKLQPHKIWAPEPLLLDRIRRAYLLALEDHKTETSVLWSNIIPSKQNDIHAAIVAGGSRYYELLAKPSLTNLYYGVDNFCADVIAAAKDIPPAAASDHVHGLLIALAESLGVEAVWNPEGGSKFPHREPKLKTSPNALLAAIDSVLGAKLFFPNPFTGEVGVDTSRGTVSLRAVNALYQAARLKKVAELIGGRRCLEIGAGTGRTAYFSWQFGLRPYTIVDLPMALVGQACFLSATIGENNIWLFGEEKPKSDDVVRLAPPHWLFAGDEHFDLVLNADSLTEMSLDYAKRYIAFITNRTEFFLSINHEANEFRVCDLLPAMFRFPYPLRTGYVEEWFFKSNPRRPVAVR
jgi:hypothetical protein